MRGHTPAFRVHGTEIKVSIAAKPGQTRKIKQQDSTVIEARALRRVARPARLPAARGHLPPRA
jgi:hypothetical protein